MQKKYSLLLLCLFLYGCDIFDTRDAAPPAIPRTEGQVATSSDQLLINFFNSVRQKNADNYTATFSDSSTHGSQFIFVPSSQALSTYPVFFNQWGKREEERYFKNFTTDVSASSNVVVSLFDSSTTKYGDSVLYNVRYSLVYTAANNPEPFTYSGEMRLKMKVGSNLIWKIYQWEDYKNSSGLSWSDLKGENY